MRICDIDTPALIVDLEALEANLQSMAGFFRDRPAKLRPHFKNHKVPLLAWKQINAGAIGMTCATLSEAEILARHGIRSILIANEIAGANKIRQFAALSRHAEAMVAVDSESCVSEMARISRELRTTLNVVIDIEVGLNRCGVAPGETACRLAVAAAREGLQVCGIMGYEGHLQALPPSPERDERVRRVVEALLLSRNLIEAAGIPVGIVSTGGTGTYYVGGDSPGITEIQAGSYLLMDSQYVRRGSPFAPALTLLATVISRPQPDRAVIDCGVKALSGERGLSTVKGFQDVELKALHAVHGLLEVRNPAVPLCVGQKLELWVHYSDATVNLHEKMYGVRHGEVEEILKIER